MRVFLKYWLIVIAWMVVIFSASSDQLSFQRSSRILAPLIRWLLPELPEESVYAAVTFIRKCAHFCEFGVLALLLWRALRKPQRGDTRPWDWKGAMAVLMVVIVYATTDELHQSLVASRQASVPDVLIDSAGAFLGLIFLWALGRWRRRW